MMSTKGIMGICEKIGEPKTHTHVIRDVRNILESLDAVLRLNITDSYEGVKEKTHLHIIRDIRNTLESLDERVLVHDFE